MDAPRTAAHINMMPQRQDKTTCGYVVIMASNKRHTRTACFSGRSRPAKSQAMPLRHLWCCMTSVLGPRNKTLCTDTEKIGVIRFCCYYEMGYLQSKK
jgi:hypothetical protein